MEAREGSFSSSRGAIRNSTNPSSASPPNLHTSAWKSIRKLYCMSTHLIREVGLPRLELVDKGTFHGSLRGFEDEVRLRDGGSDSEEESIV